MTTPTERKTIMNPLTQPLATLIAWWRAKPHDERGGIQITTENLLWTLLVIAILGLVGGVMTGYVQSLLSSITGGH